MQHPGPSEQAGSLQQAGPLRGGALSVPSGTAVRRALLLGGAGMLANPTAELVADGWQVVLPSRRYAPIPDAAAEHAAPSAGEGKLPRQQRRSPETVRAEPVEVDLAPARGRARWVRADWLDPSATSIKVAAALGGRADLLVVWLPLDLRVAAMRAMATLLAVSAPVVEVFRMAPTLDAAPGGLPAPALQCHQTQQLALGFVDADGRARSMTSTEVRAGLREAIGAALRGSVGELHQFGEPRPWPVPPTARFSGGSRSTTAGSTT
ncbi:MAG: hypothetical protein ACRDRL_26860 [Sciscionella sp.]